MKRLLLAAATAVILAGCSSTAATPTPTTAAPAGNPTPTGVDLSKVTIAYSGYSTSNSYWNTLGKAAADEAKAKGVNFVDITATTNDSALQLQAVNSELATLKAPAVLIIGSVDNNVFGDSIKTAKANGVIVLAVDTAIDDPYISALIQTDNVKAGEMLGDLICQNTGGKGSVLDLGGTVGAQTGDARQQGVYNKTSACGLNVIKQNGNWDSATDVNLANAAITANPDLAAIFVPHSDGAAAVAQVVGQKNLQSKIGVYGFDGSPAEIDDIVAGTEVASIHQDNVGMGKTIVDDAITLLQGGSVSKTVLIPPVLITKDNASSFK
jgi:ribose transport system substrate-binding protein